MRRTLAKPQVITLILIMQFVPFILFPPSSFTMTSQEWWLPVLLGIMVIVGVFQLVFRRSTAMWPWYLVSFSQGFNIISRILMLMPHATTISNGQQVFNTGYVLLAFLSILLSTFLLWFTELPEVRIGLLRALK